MTMTTETTWLPIPGYSSYEINSDGVVRVIESGNLYPLDTFVPDKSKPDEVSETYLLRHDEEGFRVVSKQHLVHEIFHPNTENLDILDRNEDANFHGRWSIYRVLRNEGKLDWLLSDECSPRWNEFFAEVKEYEDNLDDEGRFHASLHIYGWNNPDGWHRMMEATRACLVLGFATPDDARKWDWLGGYVADAFEFNDDNGGRYDVKDLTMEQAWDWTISFCQRPFKDSGEKFWALWCLDDKSSDYPDWRKFAVNTQQYVQSQPFEVLEQWLTYLKECGELDDYLEISTFETLTHFKHYTPEWDERFKALVPGWEPWVDPCTWTVIPGFSDYEMTDEEEAKPWNVRGRGIQIGEDGSAKGFPQVTPQRTFDYDQADADGNPLEIYRMTADDGTSVQITYQELLERTYPNES